MLAARSLLGSTALTPTPAKRKAGLSEPHAAHQNSKKYKDKIASRYDEAISYAMPGRDGIHSGPDQSAIYDDTAVLAAPEFASRIQQGILPNFARWASFVAGILVPEEELEELGSALEKIDLYLYEMIGSSNFTVEVNEAILDLAIGTGAIRIDESAQNNPFNTRAVPLRSLDFGIGPDGLPDPICETRHVPYEHIQVIWPEASMPRQAGANMETELEIVEIWQRDWSRPTEWAYRQTVFIPSLNNEKILTKYEEGEGANPYLVFRWSKGSGEGWGRGPLFNVLPSMRKVNFAERALLDHTDLSLAGIWTVEDDGVINPDTVRLDPGTLVPRAVGSQPLQNVAPSGNFEIAQYTTETSRMNIRKALFTEQLGAPEGTPMSATEVTQRMTELARAIGSPFARLIIELVMPAVARFVRILKDRKLIKMPEVDGKEIKLMSTSPLAMAQNFEDIDRIERYLASLGQLFGPQALQVMVDQVETSHKLAKLYHVPKGVVRPKEKQAEMMQQIAQSLQGPAQDGQTNSQNPAESQL